MGLMLNLIYIIDEVEFEPQIFSIKLPPVFDDVEVRAVCRPSGKVSAQPHTSLCIQSFVRRKQ